MRNNKDVYLSVDIDYFYNHNITGDGLDFVKELYALNRPITLFKQHQSILSDITKQYAKITNVDFHSDIVDPNCYNTLTCANWTNHVLGRDKATYEWLYPNYSRCVKNGWGLCHYCADDETWDKHDPFFHPEWKLWKSLKRGSGIDGIDLSRVDRIGLVLSPVWLVTLVVYDTLDYIEGHRNTRFFSQRTKNVLRRMLREPTKRWEMWE